jgi:hypothetical protein
VARARRERPSDAAVEHFQGTRFAVENAIFSLPAETERAPTAISFDQLVGASSHDPGQRQSELLHGLQIVNKLNMVGACPAVQRAWRLEDAAGGLPT